MYICPNCGNVSDELPKISVRCLICGHRYICKMRPPVAKLVKAR